MECKVGGRDSCSHLLAYYNHQYLHRQGNPGGCLLPHCYVLAPPNPASPSSPPLSMPFRTTFIWLLNSTTVREELQLDAEFVIVEQTQMEYLSRAWTAPCCLSWQPTAHSSCSYLTYLPINGTMEKFNTALLATWTWTAAGGEEAARVTLPSTM